MEQFCKSSQKELEREWYAKKQMALDWDGIVLLIKPKKLERVQGVQKNKWPWIGMERFC